MKLMKFCWVRWFSKQSGIARINIIVNRNVNKLPITIRFTLIFFFHSGLEYPVQCASNTQSSWMFFLQPTPEKVKWTIFLHKSADTICSKLSNAVALDKLLIKKCHYFVRYLIKILNACRHSPTSIGSPSLACPYNLWVFKCLKSIKKGMDFFLKLNISTSHSKMNRWQSRYFRRYNWFSCQNQILFRWRCLLKYRKTSGRPQYHISHIQHGIMSVKTLDFKTVRRSLLSTEPVWKFSHWLIWDRMST